VTNLCYIVDLINASVSFFSQLCTCVTSMKET